MAVLTRSVPFLRLPASLLLLAGLSFSQHRVDPKNTYPRIVAVVPIVGKGTPTDPKRPQYAPWPPSPNPPRNAIIAYSFQISSSCLNADVKAFDKLHIVRD